MEGDLASAYVSNTLGDFYPRPPGGGRPCIRLLFLLWRYFYPRPPGGGRPSKRTAPPDAPNFYPRPPGGGRPVQVVVGVAVDLDFYPRPPGGGRRRAERERVSRRKRFLSTPSGWRATLCEACHNKMHPISIHALRVEGDNFCLVCSTLSANFYPRPPGGGRRHKIGRDMIQDLFLSTPSGWRATPMRCPFTTDRIISIHALRVEGDEPLRVKLRRGGRISIHALRVEGDQCSGRPAA